VAIGGGLSEIWQTMRSGSRDESPGDTPYLHAETGHTGHHLPTEIPDEARFWNWGAFLFTWIWAIFNGTWIGLLALIPGLNLVMAFILGMKGNDWAWRNGTWKSTSHFIRTQRMWNRCALIAAVSLTLVVGLSALTASL
jgi:hypothetical protein